MSMENTLMLRLACPKQKLTVSFLHCCVESDPSDLFIWYLESYIPVNAVNALNKRQEMR